MPSHHSPTSKSNTKYTIDVVAENALLLSWPAQISLSQHDEILNLQALLKQQLHDIKGFLTADDGANYLPNRMMDE